MARKTVNIITPHFTPEITAAAHRMEAAAKILSCSYKVNVFTLAYRGSKLQNHIVKYDEYLSVHYIPAGKYNKSLFFIRAFFEWFYAMKLIRKANKTKADLAIITVPFIFLLPVAAAFCSAKRKAADVRDLVWHYLSSSGILKSLIKGRITSLMHRSLSKFDAVTVTNEAEKRWLLSFTGIKEEKLMVIPNGISTEKFFRISEMNYAPNKEKFIITYIGNIGSSQHFTSLIEAVKDMDDVRLNLIGDGNEYKSIERFIAASKIKNVYLYGKKQWSQILPLYQTSHLLYASLKDEYDTAIPSKLYEYLATGLPVLYEGSGAATQFLSTFKNTFIVLNHQPKYLEKVIKNIRRLKPGRSEENMRTIQRLFLREKLSRRFVELAAGLVNEKTLSGVYVEDILLSTKT